MSLIISLVLMVFLSALICSLEVRHQSKVNTLSLCCTGAFAVYVAIMIVGNAATTVVAYAIVQSHATSIKTIEGGSGAVSAAPTMSSSTTPSPRLGITTAEGSDLSWFWAAFLGVFAFESMLQRINVTFGNQGVLTINDWIAKARDGAIEATLAAKANAQMKSEQILATKLDQSTALDDSKLNSYVQSWLGPTRVTELEQLAATGHANPRLTKALALAVGAYDRASKLV